jgi:hypothetical protein
MLLRQASPSVRVAGPIHAEDLKERLKSIPTKLGVDIAKASFEKLRMNREGSIAV